MKESVLRDLIAENIHKLKAGLTLLKAEQYIPGDHCTKSFIDLYAKDDQGRHVLIELKRSRAASRQAIHEVYKYAERIKQYFGAKDSEIVVIIASTEWEELLVPFSRFCAEVGFSVEGIALEVSEDESAFRAEPITPLKITQGRFLAPWHHVYWYSNKEALQKGISEIENAYQGKGMEDYIIVPFYAPDPSTAEERSAALQKQVAGLLNQSPEALSTALFSVQVPKHEFAAYVAVQMLSQETCLQIISRDADRAEEVQESLAVMDEEEALRYLHECIELVAPFHKPEYYEIGYPSKFSYFYENLPCLGMIRRGAFARNSLLKDEMLYAELRGEDGVTGQKYKSTIPMQDSARVRALKDRLSSMLANNPVWRNHILRIVDEIGAEFPSCDIDISIFNPGTGVFTVYYALTKEQGGVFLPSYTILVKNPDVVRMYYGALEATGEAVPFSELLETYYEGCLLSLLETTIWGARDERDGDIMESLGLQYRSYLVNIVDDAAVDCYTFRDEKWRPCQKASLFDLFDDYLRSNPLLINQLLSRIVPHDKGSFFDSMSSDAVLANYADMATAQKQRSYYVDAPECCDICQCTLSDGKFMVDGEVRGTGAGATMCADCFIAFGTTIGWEDGQLYRKDPNGWLLVGGFCPDGE